LYGSQLFEVQGGDGMRLEPIEDEANVDERRAKMGLGPLAEYLKRFGIEYRKPTRTAPNPSLNSDPTATAH
jgi:transposase